MALHIRYIANQGLAAVLIIPDKVLIIVLCIYNQELQKDQKFSQCSNS